MPKENPAPVEVHTPARSGAGYLSPRWQRLLLWLCIGQFVLLISLTIVWMQLPPSAEPRRGRPYSPTNRDPFFLGSPGPWGELEFVRINVEPPDDFLLPGLKPFAPTRWTFPDRSPAQVRAFLEGCDLTAEQRAMLSSEVAWTEESGRVVITPGAKFILGLSPAARLQIYSVLAESQLNPMHCNPYTFRDGGFEDWFKSSGLSPATLAQIRRLVYPRGAAICFSDLPEVITLIPTQAEQRRLIKTLWRNPTVMMKLRIRPDTDVNALTAYWSRGWHVKDIGSLLESLTRVPGSITIDVAHLLPPFARRRLNSYPNPATYNPPDQAPDCFWSSLNFFKDLPDDRFFDPTYWLPELEQNYTIVKEPTFGDVLLFVTEEGMPIHAAVYVADDVVFTKNGADFRQPWILMKLDDLMARYHHTDKIPVHYLIHRAKVVEP